MSFITYQGITSNQHHQQKSFRLFKAHTSHQKKFNSLGLVQQFHEVECTIIILTTNFQMTWKTAKASFQINLAQPRTTDVSQVWYQNTRMHQFTIHRHLILLISKASWAYHTSRLISCRTWIIWHLSKAILAAHSTIKNQSITIRPTLEIAKRQ